MGCSSSASTGQSKQVQSVRPTILKAPVMLFYLPGNVKETLIKLLSTHLSGSETGTHAVANLNVRFIDVPNQRSMRKYWVRELSQKTDIALSIYLADVRDKPTRLLNIKTINWFLKQTHQKYPVQIVLICQNEREVNEFKSNVSLKELDIIIINDNEPETVFSFSEFITGEVMRFNEKKKRSAEGSPRVK